jgi:hypothetical protein
MREICSYGSVGVPAGNRRHYPARELVPGAHDHMFKANHSSRTRVQGHSDPFSSLASFPSSVRPQ